MSNNKQSDTKFEPSLLRKIWAVICFISTVLFLVIAHHSDSSKKLTSTEIKTMLKDKTKSEVKSILGKPYRAGDVWHYRKLAWDNYAEKYQDCLVHFYPSGCSDPACWVEDVNCY